MSEHTQESTQESTQQSSSGQVEKAPAAPISDAILAELKSPADVQEYLTSVGGELEDLDDYGPGFVLEDDKDTLIGVPFVIAEWRWNWSQQYENHFATMYVVTDQGQKLIVNDGSVKKGIAQQLRDVEAKRRASGREENAQRGLAVMGGLSRSDYQAVGKPGDPNYRPAGTTYFLAPRPTKNRR